MAFVKLPEAVRDLEIETAAGREARVEITVFAGETVRLSQRASGPGARPDRLTSLWVRSPRSEQRFDFEELPTPFEPGDVVGVVAAIPEGREDGPILSAANLDADRRVDFLDQERELLLLLSGLDRDHRAIGYAGPAISAGVRAGIIGLLAWIGLGAAALLARGEAGPFDGPILEVLGRIADASRADPIIAVVAAAGAAVAFTALFVAEAVRNARRARRQTAILRQVWRRVGESLGFVQQHANAFRVKKLADPAAVEAPAARETRPPEPPRAAAAQRPAAHPGAARVDAASRPPSPRRRPPEPVEPEAPRRRPVERRPSVGAEAQPARRRAPSADAAGAPRGPLFEGSTRPPSREQRPPRRAADPADLERATERPRFDRSSAERAAARRALREGLRAEPEFGDRPRSDRFGPAPDGDGR